LFFNGGDIGKLAVCGTINDLAMGGARPVALSLSLIIETGLEMEVLERILESTAKTAMENNVEIVTGDTKTVETGAADKLFINTAGIGMRLAGIELGFDKIEVGDELVISGTIGDHGMTIMSQREGMSFQNTLKSDCAALAGLTCELLEKVEGVKFMRDPTRGGVAAVLNETVRATGLSIEIDENRLPVEPQVRGAADMLGFDILNIANEGKFIAVVAAGNGEKAAALCRKHPLGKRAAVIGRVTKTIDTAVVEMNTKIGGRRIVQMPYGRELPRIC
jgi:hydrogenase expression/formation protein HypE